MSSRALKKVDFLCEIGFFCVPGSCFRQDKNLGMFISGKYKINGGRRVVFILVYLVISGLLCR